MKNYFNYNFIEKTIVGSNASIKRANSGIGNEYTQLCKMLAEHPDFKVVPKDIKENHGKKKYNGLTFDRMKEFISTQPDSENKLKVFEKVLQINETKGAKYPLTKKWFLSKYPEYKDNNTVVSDEEAEAIANAELDAIEDENEDEVA